MSYKTTNFTKLVEKENIQVDTYNRKETYETETSFVVKVRINAMTTKDEVVAAEKLIEEAVKREEKLGHLVHKDLSIASDKKGYYTYASKIIDKSKYNIQLYKPTYSVSKGTSLT
ncbi:MAG: hypothetical protein FWD89_03875 [Firmicutes bacterium]|nr:hypothetical protein [Bacillota bacterium]MCL2771422.1 hypothetical protein [Bacillota bacterium]